MGLCSFGNQLYFGLTNRRLHACLNAVATGHDGTAAAAGVDVVFGNNRDLFAANTVQIVFVAVFFLRKQCTAGGRTLNPIESEKGGRIAPALFVR